MARPTKHRRVCQFPGNLSFIPENGEGYPPVVLTVDEYETIRLIDLEGLSQEACGVQLGIGRTTAQKIYETARKKLADALVNGLPLQIDGGDFRLCTGDGACYRKHCFKKEIQSQYGIYGKEKGDTIMRIAVTYENGNIFGHFGHTEQFKVYDVENGSIVATKIVDTNGQGHGALAGVLSALQADVLICGGIGGGAQMALAEAGIKLYGGVTGNADAAVKALLSDSLAYNPDVHCDHHDHEHGEGGHTCGSHGCGGGSCGHH